MLKKEAKCCFSLQLTPVRSSGSQDSLLNTFQPFSEWVHHILPIAFFFNSPTVQFSPESFFVLPLMIQGWNLYRFLPEKRKIMTTGQVVYVNPSFLFCKRKRCWWHLPYANGSIYIIVVWFGKFHTIINFSKVCWISFIVLSWQITFSRWCDIQVMFHTKFCFWGNTCKWFALKDAAFSMKNPESNFCYYHR